MVRREGKLQITEGSVHIPNRAGLVSQWAVAEIADESKQLRRVMPAVAAI